MSDIDSATAVAISSPASRRNFDATFTPISDCLLRSKTLTVGEKVVLSHLRRMGKIFGTDRVHPTQERLAEELGMSEDSITRHVRALARPRLCDICASSHSFLQIARRGGRYNSNKYTLLTCTGVLRGPLCASKGSSGTCNSADLGSENAAKLTRDSAELGSGNAAEVTRKSASTIPGQHYETQKRVATTDAAVRGIANDAEVERGSTAWCTQQLTENGVSDAKTASLIQRYSLEAIVRQIEVFSGRRDSEKIRNPAGFLVSAIEGNWPVAARSQSTVTPQSARRPRFPFEFNQWTEPTKNQWMRENGYN